MVLIFSHIFQDIPPVPWREMAKSVPLWGLIFAQIGHDWGFFTLVTDLPKYFKDVMRFNIFEVSKSGLTSTVANGFYKSVITLLFHNEKECTKCVINRSYSEFLKLMLYSKSWQEFFPLVIFSHQYFNSGLCDICISATCYYILSVWYYINALFSSLFWHLLSED